ncbi:caspase family protein [Roseibium salinum]|nr:caspase family protein [Roseibium salinum]
MAGEWRALVIGIDAYEHVSPLKGAVNDAQDIAQTLRAAGVSDLTMLLDGDASRAAVLSSWQELVSRSAEDDILVFVLCRTRGAGSRMGGGIGRGRTGRGLSARRFRRHGSGERGKAPG